LLVESTYAKIKLHIFINFFNAKKNNNMKGWCYE